MKRLAAAAALLLLTGCTPDIHPIDPPQETAASTDRTLPTIEESPAVIPAITEETTAPVDTDADALYEETLRALREDGILPSGARLDVVGDLSDNRYAVYDIDGDGREELLLDIVSAAPRDRYTAVYDVDADGDLHREVRYTADLSFWTDGIVLAEYSAAAREEGDFVPYAVSQYDEEQDVYTEFAYVSAIDKETLADAGKLDEYPQTVDTSDMGRVYFIQGTPVDVTDYEAWYASWRNGLEALDVPWKKLSEGA